LPLCKKKENNYKKEKLYAREISQNAWTKNLFFTYYCRVVSLFCLS